MFGDGMGKTRLQSFASLTSLLSILALRVVLKDLTITGSMSSGYGIFFAQHQSNNARHIFERVEIEGVRGNPGYGLYGGGGQWLCTFDKISINNCNIGLYLDGSGNGFQGTIIRDTLVRGNLQENIHLKGGTGRPNPIWLHNVDVELRYTGSSAIRKGIVVENVFGPIVIENPYYENEPGFNDPASLFLEILTSTTNPHVYLNGGRMRGGADNQINCMKINGNAEVFVSDTLFDRFTGEVIDGIGESGKTVELRNTRIRTGKLYGTNYSDTTFPYLRDEGGSVTEIDPEGYFKPIKVSSLPGASANYRGKVVRVEGGAGVKDKFYICEKTSSDGYAWTALT